MKLRYKASNKEGKIVQGLMEANDVNEAASYLHGKELMPIRIEAVGSGTLNKLLPFLNKISTSDVILFTRQLSSMLSSGLTLLRALQIFKDQIQNEAMIEVVTGIINDIEEGKPFSFAIAKYPDVFSPIYVSLIKAAETSGLLDKVLLRLANNLEKEQKLRGTVKSALMYPAIVVILMLVVVFIMMIFVIPQLSTLYQSLNVPLPLPTQIVVGLSGIIGTFWPVIIVLVGLGIFLFKRWRKTEDGQLIVDNLILKIPIFGELIEQTILSEFTRTFGLLIGTGTLVVESLTESADTTGNVHYRRAINDVSKQVEKGVSIGDAMSGYTLFPPMLVQLVKIGEQTGKMDETLTKASEYYEDQVNQTVKTLTTAMEPFIMIVLGVGVAFLIISVITPIYSLISSLQ
ncbi:MAG TPA: type II secretion system F family protein [Patescibacteria group bacterium]|nr:type II secretion system F family protein [Patescibacteria group bacterium]